MPSTPSKSCSRLGLLLAVAFMSVLVAESAAAQFTMSASAGIFDPWREDGNQVFRGAAGATFGKGKRFRLSGEFAYREFESEIFGVKDVDIDSYQIALVFHYRLLPDAAVQPYVGVRSSVAVNQIDDGAIERAKNDLVRVDDTTSSIGVAAILGIEFPIGEHFFLFAETDIGAEFLFTQDDDGYRDNDYYDDNDVNVEQIGGIHGVAGVRVVF